MHEPGQGRFIYKDVAEDATPNEGNKYKYISDPGILL